MQEFTSPPQTTSPYTPAGGSNMAPNMPTPPRLGTPIPGTVGGMPAQGGLSVFQNPLAGQLQSSPQNSAQQAQSYGRGNDSMLIHMTPDEVGGLQALAMAHGGSLTINPHTGLPEAGFLGKILPTLLGVLGAAVGLPTWALALGGTAAGTIASGGDLGKGLMAGLGAWGGASLAGGLGLGKAGTDLVPKIPAGADVSGTGLPNISAANKSLQTAGGAFGNAGEGIAGNVLNNAGKGIAGNVLNNAAEGIAGNVLNNAGKGIAGNVLNNAAEGIAGNVLNTTGLPTAKTGLAGFAQRFGLKAAKDMPGFLGKYAPYAAGLGLVNTVSELTTPEGVKYDPDEEKSSPYTPMVPGRRVVSYQTPEQMRESGGAEYRYFTPTNPDPIPESSLTDELNKDYGYADGGLAALETPAGFNDLVSYFKGTSPGAITASRTYPTKAATEEKKTEAVTGKGGTAGSGTADTSEYVNYPDSQGERVYTFGNSKKATSSGGGTALPGKGGVSAGGASADTTGYASIPGVGNVSIPDMSSPEMQALIRQYQQGTGTNTSAITPQTPPAMDYSGISMPDFSGMDFSQYAPQMPPAAAPEPAPQTDFTPFLVSGEEAASGTPMGGGGKGGNPVPQEAAAQPATPSYAGTDFSQYAPQTPQAPPPPAYDYNQYTPDFSNFSMPDFSGMDFSQYAPQTPQAPPPPEYDYSQYTPDYYNYQFRKGGEVPMRDGSFVMDARSVSELGNGSSNAGKEVLARMGGRPLNGPGDGVSDSIPARIGGRQEARVARDEVLFPPQAVRRIGGGSERRGTQKLYALMDKAHRARKQAKRGQDTKLARGLGALV